jgi:hypothetical protein
MVFRISLILNFAFSFFIFAQDQHNFDLPKRTLRVAASGDPQAITYDKYNEMPFYARVLSLNADVVTIAGDMNEHGENAFHWDTLESLLQELNFPYQAPNTFFYPVHGDHDLINLSGQADWDQRWINRFDLPGNETFFSFRRNNVFFIAVSYPACPIAQYNLNSVQLPWVTAQLDSASKNPDIDWIYVYFHDPLVYENPAFAKLFTQYGVNIVHHGDKHRFYRSQPLDYPASGSGAQVNNEPGKGFVVFEAAADGGGGAYGSNPAWSAPAWTGGIILFEFNGKIMKASALRIRDGAVLDTWTRLSLRNGQVSFDSVSASHANVSIEPHTTAQVNLVAHFSDGDTVSIANPDFSKIWSADTNIAVISETGLITGKAAGSTQIILRSFFDPQDSYTFDKYDTVNVTVNASTAVLDSLVADAAAVLLSRDDPLAGSRQVSVKGYYTTNNSQYVLDHTQDADWQSQDGGIASVSQGLITAQTDQGGPVNITAAYGGKTAVISVTVTQNNPVIRINFQDVATPFKTGWEADNGTAYSSAKGFGWTNGAGSTRERPGDNYLLQTFVSSGSSEKPYRIDVPDGRYTIRIAMGDIQYGPSPAWVVYGSDTLLRHIGQDESPYDLPGYNTITTSNIEVTGGNGLLLGVSGAINYIVLVSEGVDINQVADDEYESPVSVYVKKMEDRLPALNIKAFPSPFTSSINISVSSLESQDPGLELGIYDLKGRLIKDLSANHIRNGIIWNASDYPSGIYILSLISGKRKVGKRITLIK